MNTSEFDAAEFQADFQTVINCISEGKPIPAEVRARVRERSERAQEELLKTHGVQDVGVSIIREIRGDSDA
jgi:hypothetical protein